MSISFRCAVRRTTPVRANRASARSQNDLAPAVIPLFLHIAPRHAHGVMHRAVSSRDRCATSQRGRRRTISASEVEIDLPLA
ncbi:hypothetical protein C6T56_22195 [Burkholderia multivorans]|nr:hypothetical protein C6T56_22195 [Burkholderia multivorans]